MVKVKLLRVREIILQLSDHHVPRATAVLKCLDSEAVPETTSSHFLKSPKMSNDTSTRELLSLTVSRRILEILDAVGSDASITAMEASITTFTLVSTRLQLSTRRKRSIISELTEILNQFEEHQRSLLTMQARREMYDWTTANPHDHLLNVASMIQISGQISSAAQIKNHFCTLYVRRLQEIGCYPIRGSSSTPTYIIPNRSPNMNHRPSLQRMNATLNSENGNNRRILENHEMRGKLSLLAAGPAPGCGNRRGGCAPTPLRTEWNWANWRRVKSLILWGGTRTGKTLYARSLGHHAYYNLQFNMDDFSNDCKYAVFDDIQGGFEYWHSYKGWLGAQKQFVITDKYRKKRTIHWGKPSIMCTNDDPFAMRNVDYDWLMNNCYIINVVDPICIVSS